MQLIRSSLDRRIYQQKKRYQMAFYARLLNDEIKEKSKKGRPQQGTIKLSRNFEQLYYMDESANYQVFCKLLYQ